MRVLSFASLALLTIVVSGCLNGDYNADAGVMMPADMTAKTYDLTGDDLAGAYNCAQLNACERACATPVCVYMCRNMATPQAIDKDSALQNCFTQYCPNGAGQVCDGSSGMRSNACNVCITNTYIPTGQSCSPTQNPSECSQCVDQANACTADM
jgi:hypothetical protein